MASASAFNERKCARCSVLYIESENVGQYRCRLHAAEYAAPIEAVRVDAQGGYSLNDHEALYACCYLPQNNPTIYSAKTGVVDPHTRIGCVPCDHHEQSIMDAPVSCIPHFLYAVAGMARPRKEAIVLTVTGEMLRDRLRKGRPKVLEVMLTLAPPLPVVRINVLSLYLRVLNDFVQSSYYDDARILPGLRQQMEALASRRAYASSWQPLRTGQDPTGPIVMEEGTSGGRRDLDEAGQRTKAEKQPSTPAQRANVIRALTDAGDLDLLLAMEVPFDVVCRVASTKSAYSLHVVQAYLRRQFGDSLRRLSDGRSLPLLPELDE